MRQRSSQEFKNAFVEKLLNRGERSMASVCEEAGVVPATAKRWLKNCGKLTGNSKPRGRMKWSAETKLKAVAETLKLSEHDFGLYLRREGYYSTQIAEWRDEIIGHFNSKPKLEKDSRDGQIQILEKEILRKDKALAEASALLILQKKVDLIWGVKGEDER